MLVPPLGHRSNKYMLISEELIYQTLVSYCTKVNHLDFYEYLVVDFLIQAYSLASV